MFPFFKKNNKSTSVKDGDFLGFLKKIIGYKPKEIHYYKKAFTHSSFKQVVDGKSFNYERLEFLGDAIIDTIVSAFLYNIAPLENEGYLTKMRSKIVSRQNLNRLGKDLDLLKFINSAVSQDKFGDNIYGNIYEALVGAVFLDKGYVICEKFVNKTLITPYVDIERLEGKITSYKSVLIEWCQKHKKEIYFKVSEEPTKERIKHFTVKLFINKKQISKGRAPSKKKAEEIAAKRAYYTFQTRIEKIRNN
jgi:ribonuclease-3